MNNENNNLTSCPHCKSKFDWIDPQYCPFCGKLIFNYCTNAECAMCPDSIHHEENWCLDSSYKFCPDCGSKSTFYDRLSKDKNNGDN